MATTDGVFSNLIGVLFSINGEIITSAIHRTLYLFFHTAGIGLPSKYVSAHPNKTIFPAPIGVSLYTSTCTRREFPSINDVIGALYTVVPSLFNISTSIFELGFNTPAPATRNALRPP